MNSFFASCEQQENPALRGHPVAVVPVMTDSTSCIAASYEAKRLGIKTGTRVSDAKRIYPKLKIVLARHDLYVRYHYRVREALESCIPIHKTCSIDEFCCELTGSQQDLLKAKSIALKIKEAIKTQVGEYVTSSIGLGPNNLLAKIAADMQKPNGLTSIELADLPHKLHTLKLSDIPGVGQKMEMRLNRQGIYTMEQFLNLNEQQMHAVWGSIVGSRYYYLFKGKHFDIPRHENKSIGHQHVLPPQDRNFTGAQTVAQKLISKAAVRLRRSNKMARKMSVQIKYLSGCYFEAQYNMPENQDTGMMIKLFNADYSKSAPRREKPVRVGITLHDFIDNSEHQLSFFMNEKRNELFRIVDKINNKYGRDTVYVGSLHEQLESAPTRIAFSRIPELDEL